MTKQASLQWIPGRDALLRITVIVAFGGLLGCDDDPSGTSADADMLQVGDTAQVEDSSTIDAPTPDTLACCPELCPPGTLCDDTACACVAQPCAAAGDVCDPADAATAGFLCVAEGATGGVCRTTCTDDTECGDDYCETDGTNSWCQPDGCADFWNNDCAEGSKCIPVREGIDRCVLTGTREAYESCSDHAECGADLLCLDDRCRAPDCAPLTRASVCEPADDCDVIEFDGANLDIGICETLCVAFSSNSGCDSTEWCRPVNDVDGEIVGICEEDLGIGLDGNPCADNYECQDDHMCMRGVCKRMCDPDTANGAGACTLGSSTCTPFFDGTPFATPWGLCLRSCDLFEESTCFTNEWCVPSLFTNTSHCLSTGGLSPEGEYCDFALPETTCQDGAICLESRDCRTVCDPEALAGSLGDTCPVDTVCAALGNGMGGTLSFGFCTPTCDFHGGQSMCDDPARTLCMMGEIFFAEEDYCQLPPAAFLESGESCTINGMGANEPCGSNSMCLELPADVDVLCTDICVPTMTDPYGTVGHPDCRDPALTCQGVFGATFEFGVCR